MRTTALIFLFVLSGCQTVSPVSLPDGPGFVVTCDGGIRSMASCMNKAAEFCGGEYEALGQDQSKSVTNIGTNIVTTHDREMYFRCK